MARSPVCVKMGKGERIRAQRAKGEMEAKKSRARAGTMQNGNGSSIMQN